MKRAVSAFLVSCLTALFWWIVFMAAYASALFEGDRNPTLPPPSDQQVLTHTIGAIAIGVVIYALILVLLGLVLDRFKR